MKPSTSNNNNNNNKQQQQHRIACLIPSATDICIALELTRSIAGVTHECYNNYPNLFHSTSTATTTTSRQQQQQQGEEEGRVEVSILTVDRIENAESISQKEIDQLVEDNAKQALEAISNAASPCDEIPSLYPLRNDALNKAKPTLVLTQDLCKVCAPSSDSVRQAILNNNNNKKDRCDEGCPEDNNSPRIISLTPNTLMDVLDNITTVADACGVSERGRKLREQIFGQLRTIQLTVRSNRDTTKPEPTMFVLEWLDPPYDGAHWINPDMMEYAGVQPAVGLKKKADGSRRKSQKLQWGDVERPDPDVIMIACCGFNLQRNVDDGYAEPARTNLSKLRAGKEGRVFATDGDSYFARPGPHLLQGVAIMAVCAYQDQPQVIRELKQLPFISKALNAWKSLDFSSSNNNNDDREVVEEKITPDIEDFHMLHEKACEAGEKFYIDPKTGYSVFTELAHKQRGKCCGSGCRHCPYSHENVAPDDKANKIQQPAFLYYGDNDTDDNSSNNILGLHHGNIRVLFFSGGKDSYLTVRALAREAAAKAPFGLVLLTTFDAISREIAHQEVNVSQVKRQAEHLGVALVGVPVHRGTTESYDQRIRRALDVIEKHAKQKVKALVFGDLHLEHVYKWRQDNMGSTLGTYDLQFPLWKVDYELLEDDLEKSGVKCVVSASTVDGISSGDIYDKAFRERIRKGEIGMNNSDDDGGGNNNNNIDLFGENGEFHTLANVWCVDRNRALGIE